MTKYLLLLASSAIILVFSGTTIAQKPMALPALPQPAPCTYNADQPEACHARIEAEVVKAAVPRETILVIRTMNVSKDAIFVQESNEVDTFSLQVKDLWGNPVALTEKEQKRRYPRSRNRAYLNHWLPVAPGEESIQKLRLSEVYSIEQPGWYTVIISQLIYKSENPRGFESLLEYAKSSLISFKVYAEDPGH
jgi:hypothetical protein